MNEAGKSRNKREKGGGGSRVDSGGQQNIAPVIPRLVPILLQHWLLVPIICCARFAEVYCISPEVFFAVVRKREFRF